MKKIEHDADPPKLKVSSSKDTDEKERENRQELVLRTLLLASTMENRLSSTPEIIKEFRIQKALNLAAILIQNLSFLEIQPLDGKLFPIYYKGLVFQDSIYLKKVMQIYKSDFSYHYCNKQSFI